MRKSVVWLRASYWAGAVVDGIAAIVLFCWDVFPGFASSIFGKADMLSPSFQSLRWSFATLVLSWTCLLLWADRKPLERKGVMFLTIFPLAVLLFGRRIYVTLTGQHATPFILFTLFEVLLLLFFVFSYHVSGDAAGKQA